MGTPDFLVIGAARSGTTWLARTLGAHPDIAMSVPKEPNFLAASAVRASTTGPGDSLVAERVIGDESTWRSLFPADRVAGEASVSTLHHSDVSIERIERYCPDARLVAVLRSPWDRARSAWSYQTGRGFETLSFEAALDAEARRVAEGYQFIWHYDRASRYSVQLAPFVERFGDRLLVAEYEAMFDAGTDELERIARFLDVDPAGFDVSNERVNATSSPRYASVRRVMSRAHARPVIRKSVRRVVPKRVRRSILGRLEARSDSGGVPVGLVGRFEDEIASLGELLGRDAPSWCRRVDD